MKLCKTTDLKGGEVLARAVLTPEFQVLLSDGITLRPEYIDKMIELGITEVYVKLDEAYRQERLLLKADLESSFHNKLKKIMEKHTYQRNAELVELSQTADNIISSILEEKEIVDRIYDIRERNADIYEHSISICSLATLTALKLNLSRESVHDIAVGCLLHDLGLRYLTIPYENKDIESLSIQETTEYKKHTVYAFTVLKDEKWISDLSKKIILHHHETMDGMGYPLRLKGRDIPIEAKIVIVCDTFDEMICGIGCKRQKVYKAVEYLKIFRGIKYDVRVVDAFLEFTAVYPVGSNILLSDGSIGRVIRQNKEFPDRPVLQLIQDVNGNKVSGEVIADLLKINNVFVEKVLE